MAHEYKLTLTMQDAGESVTTTGSLKDEDWERLQQFDQCADDLLKTKFVRDGMAASLEMRWDAKSRTMVVSTQLPPWDDVVVFLHKFRPIGLQCESTYFYSICNIVSKELDDPYFMGIIQEQREIYGGKRLQERFGIRVNNDLVNSEKVLYDWLNSHEYHRDKGKREYIKGLSEVLPFEALKAIFVFLLMEKVRAIHDFDELVRVVLGKTKRLEGRARCAASPKP